MTACNLGKMRTRSARVARSDARAGAAIASRRVSKPATVGRQVFGRNFSRLSPETSTLVCRASEADQMNEQIKRLEAQVTEGKVKAVNAAEVNNLLNNGWVLLDVRPPEEVEKGGIQGAVTVPLFVVDDDMSPGGLLKQMSAFGMGGWWLGNKHMKLNTKIMGQVRRGIPTDSNVIVTCQKGLRSLSACEQLAKNGYQKVAWVTGGLDSAEPGDLSVVGNKDVRFAGNGGLSDVLGWTDAHRKVNKDQGPLDGPFGVVIKAALAILFLDGALFIYNQVEALKG